MKNQYKNGQAGKLSQSFTEGSVGTIGLKKTESTPGCGVYYITVSDSNSSYSMNELVYYNEAQRDSEFESLQEDLNNSKIIAQIISSD
jgi:hypothetical protein